MLERKAPAPLKEVKDMIIFKENKETGLQCGVNDFGEVFLGDKESGYNLPDTEENRELVKSDFDYYNEGKHITKMYEWS